ncbi:MAG TPA: hypothetical protein VF048_03035 [Gemmatimonadaceae bacterium]
MMRLRRFATALMGVLLLQVMLGAVGACAMTSGEVAATLGPAESVGKMAPFHGRGGEEHAQQAASAPGLMGSSHRDGEPPAPHHGTPSHCAAAVGCVFDAALAIATTALGESSPAVTRIAAPDDRAPASVVGTPEPPPPRA